jgi:hypothetical protein
MRKLIVLGAVAVLFGLSNNAFGQYRYPYGYSNRDRIVRGICSGQLTRRETADLWRRQRQLREERRDYWSDGYLSRSEWRDLRRDQWNLRRRIWRDKHDRDRRYGYGYYYRGNGYYRRGAGAWWPRY